MTTTHLFVELLVIGLGALIWLFLLGAAVLGFDLGPIGESRWLSLETIFPLLTVAYLFGILVDRLADSAFARFDARHLVAEFGDKARDKKRYYELRRTLISEAPELWKHLEYGRSRLRICRGWCINALLLVLTLTIPSLFGRMPLGATPCQVAIWDLFFVLLAMGCWVSWNELNRKEYSKIERQAKWILRREQPTARSLRRLRHLL